jgi:glycosyltransferase involved in cell wall biosynthesis
MLPATIPENLLVVPVRLVHITTVPITLGFLRGQVGAMKSRGFDVHAVSSPGDELGAFGRREGVAVHAVAMPRRITPVRDLVALWRLWWVLRRLRPSLVHAHTPKGGLLGMAAAWLARVPVRIYHIHGLPLMTAGGLKRRILRGAETVSCRLAHRVYCVSRSIRDMVVAECICGPGKISVPAGGSINGVDSQGQFHPAGQDETVRRQVRERHAIPDSALVLGFVGRIVRDKGLGELVEAWRTLRAEFPSLHLLILGPFESEDPVPPEVESVLRSDDRIHLAGLIADPAPFYAVMDLVALPSHREGLGYAALEAGAMERPVVATRIPGCVDAVADGTTGTLVPARDAVALAGAIRRYLLDPRLRDKHGQAGRERVLREFRQDVIWEALYQDYLRLLRERRQPVPEAADLPCDPAECRDPAHPAPTGAAR